VILIIEGKIELGGKLPKQNITYTERKFMGLFGNKIHKTKKETYMDLILRMISELIDELEK